MALPEIGLLSMTQQPHHPNQPNSTTWMWNPREDVIAAEDEESWEVRAFAEDTRNMMNTTWPPRSYTCTFCRREFRSAQALGGHMNVHRRDRARLHQLHPTASSPSSSSSSSSSFILPPNAAGLCLLYHLPTAPNSATFASPPPPPPPPLSACGNSPSTLLSVSSYPPNSFDFPVVSSHSPPTIDMSSYCNSAKLELPCNGHEELDLELRLGHRPN